MHYMTVNQYKRQGIGLKSGEKALTKLQVDKLLNSITNLEDEALIRLTLSIGVRREDAVAIKRIDIDLKQNKVKYYEAKKKRIRDVPIPTKTAQVLAQWLNASKNIKSDYVFLPRRKRAKHLSGVSAWRMLQEYCKKAEVPAIPFHALRATCIKIKQAQGWSVEEVAKLIGDTVSVVQAHYSVPSDSELSERMMRTEI